MRSLKPEKAQSKCPLALNYSIFKISSWIKTTASRLSYELSVNDENKSMETGILLIKMDTAHFTLVNVEILTV